MSPLLLLLSLCNAVFLPSTYETDPTWKPQAPASLNISGVSAVACPEYDCSEVYVAQRGGNKPIVVLDTTGSFLRAFGNNSTSNKSLVSHIHGIRSPVSLLL
jgi:hypothetical protein